MDFKQVFDLFFNPGEVCEIRAFGLNAKGPWDGFAKGNGIVFGYFDNPDSFAAAADALSRTDAHGIYFTLNPVIPDFLARAVNRLKASGAKDKSTSDDNTLCHRWLPIDLDPVRVSGGTDLNSNEEEFRKAWELRNTVHDALRNEFGAQNGIPAISGNGAHLLMRLPDLKPVAENTTLIRSALTGIAHRFGSPEVDIDLKVFNPARIWKLYGTIARKSDHTEQRPQRKSYVQYTGEPPALADIPINSVSFLKKLASLAPAKEEKPAPPKKVIPFRGKDNSLGPMDVGGYLSHYGMEHSVKTDGDRTLYILKNCLFDPAHAGKDASIVQDSSGKITYHCFHNSCAGHTWQEARSVISGNENLAQFCVGYDANSSPPAKPSPIRRQKAEDLPDYFYLNDKGRLCLNTAIMADWLAEQLRPIISVNGGFLRYNYDSGTWLPMSEGAIRKIIRQTLGSEATPNRTGQVLENLRDDVHTEEAEILEANDPMILNLTNGMYNIETHELAPHDPKYYSRSQLPVAYDPDADCPEWEKFLDTTFVGAPDKVICLQDFFGYCLYPQIIFPAAMFAIGDGRNGKGVVEHALISVLGRKNVCHISLKRLEDRFGVVEIKDKLLNSVSETESGLLDVTKFKQVTAGDEVQAEKKFQGDCTFTPIAKHYISMNAFPNVKEKTDSFFRRVIVLEFSQRFDGENRDPFLKQKLEAETDGIFLWALSGLKDVLRNLEIRIGESGTAAKARHRAANNHLLSFVEEACYIGDTHMAKPQDVFKAYLTWSSESNIRHTYGKIGFYEELQLQFPEVRKFRPTGSTIEMFRGIGIMSRYDSCA